VIHNDILLGTFSPYFGTYRKSVQSSNDTKERERERGEKDNRKVSASLSDLASPLRRNTRSSQGSVFSGTYAASAVGVGGVELEDTVRVRSNSDSTVSDIDRTTEVRHLLYWFND
jgi:hypothetical protein